ncbi:MAG: TrmH family RNA methyltransferase [Ilumatobacteraceae bacterium]
MLPRPPSPPPDGLVLSNPRVQRLRRLLTSRRARRDEQAFVIEGSTLLAEAIVAGWPMEAQYAAPGVATVDGPPVHRLATGVAERIADTQSPTGLFAVAAIPAGDDAVLRGSHFVVVADGVNDPGNLGTILRSAEAAGADAVVVTPGTVDAFNPKVVRSSAGALFHVPLVEAGLDEVAAAGLRLVGTSSHRGVDHVAYDWHGRVAIVAGTEARGLADEAPIDDWVQIEHRGRAESLNVAMAMTVICFEAARSRR